MDSLIINMCYNDPKVKENKPGCKNKNFSAMCKYCTNKRVSGNVSSSTNFLNHIKVSHGYYYRKNVVTNYVLDNGLIDSEELVEAIAPRMPRLVYNSSVCLMHHA